MATKLKNLHLTKVDVVDEGANQRADIKLTKRNSHEGEGDDSGGVETGGQQETGILKRFVKWLMGEKYTMEDIEKAATSFEEQINSSSLESISDEIWNVTYALRKSLDSIIYDTELDASGKIAAMAESLGQFQDATGGYILRWGAGQTAGIVKKSMGTPSATELTVMQKDYQSLGLMISEANETKGDLEEMLKIDKSKMTPEELAAYDEMIKKYAIEVEETEPVGKGNAAKGEEDLLDEGAKKTETKKSASAPATSQTPEETDPEGGDIYKGLHPAVKAELENLKKFREEAETREFMEVAKKYEVLGKKPEELAVTLKSLKAAGGSAYDEMIAILDQAVTAQEASGVFGEIGKSGHAVATVGKSASVSKAEGIAKSLMQEDSSLTYVQALATAWERNPELMTEYENEAGF